MARVVNAYSYEVDVESGLVVEDRPVVYKVYYRYDDPGDLVEKTHYGGPVWIDITGDRRAARLYSLALSVLNEVGVEFASLEDKRLVARIAKYIVSRSAAGGLGYKVKQMARAIAYIVVHNHYPWLLPRAKPRLVRPRYLFKHGLQRFLEGRDLWREAYEIGLRLLKQQGWSSLEPLYNLLFIEYRKRAGANPGIAPAGLAAGLLRIAAYIANMDAHVTQHLLARKLGIARVTVWAAEQRIMRVLGINVLKTRAGVVLDVIVPGELKEIRQYMKPRHGSTRVVAVKIDEDLVEKLEEIAASKGITKTELIKHAINTYIAFLGDK